MGGRRAGSTGYVVVLVGAVAFVVSVFLPYYGYSAPTPGGQRSLSLVRLYMVREGGLVTGAGWLLHLFAGVAILAGIAIAGIRDERRWTPAAIAAASGVWSLMWIGTLAGASGILSPHLVGYWFAFLSIGVVVVGTVLVWARARSEGREQPTIGA